MRRIGYCYSEDLIDACNSLPRIRGRVRDILVRLVYSTPWMPNLFAGTSHRLIDDSEMSHIIAHHKKMLFKADKLYECHYFMNQ